MARMRAVRIVFSVLAVALLVSASASAGTTQFRKLEVFSWWTAGGEAEALTALFDEYYKLHPDVWIVNATVAGGAGSVAKAVLVSRMLGGDPPDTFQVHAGRELIDTWVVAGKMEPLDDLFKAEGWDKVMPGGILDIISYNGHYWSVPVNIHRSNVLWYNKKVFQTYGLKPPRTFDEFFQVADALKARGIIPFVVGSKDGWELGHVFEDVLAGVLGPEAYRGLWTGKTRWTDPRVTQALQTFKRMMTYANSDHSALTWDGAAAYLMEGKGGMLIMGDWTDGWFTAKGFKDYGWAPTPGTAGTFVALSDTFGLPKGIKNRDTVMDWLRLLGSKRGQEAFNPKKGSICARTDCDRSLFNEYLRSAMDDWQKDEIVPSVIHGAAASESWATAFKDTVALFAARGDVAAAQRALQQACEDAGVCR
ncbi:MAG: extracellular solute-binding protein [Bacillota bacterium]